MDSVVPNRKRHRSSAGVSADRKAPGGFTNMSSHRIILCREATRLQTRHSPPALRLKYDLQRELLSPRRHVTPCGGRHNLKEEVSRDH
jgi:hypothetical protein